LQLGRNNGIGGGTGLYSAPVQLFASTQEGEHGRFLPMGPHNVGQSPITVFPFGKIKIGLMTTIGNGTGETSLLLHGWAKFPKNWRLSVSQLYDTISSKKTVVDWRIQSRSRKHCWRPTAIRRWTCRNRERKTSNPDGLTLKVRELLGPQHESTDPIMMPYRPGRFQAILQADFSELPGGHNLELLHSTMPVLGALINFETALVMVIPPRR